MQRTPPPSIAQTAHAPETITPKCASCLCEASSNYVDCQNCGDVYHISCVQLPNNTDCQNWNCIKCQPTVSTKFNSLSNAAIVTAEEHAKAPSICSRKSKSSTQRKISLQLQRLAEEKMLQEKINQDYISKKYQLLEEVPSDDDESLQIEDEPNKTVQRVDTWIQTINPMQENETHLNPQSQYIKKCSTFNVTQKPNAEKGNYNLNSTWMGIGVSNKQTTQNYSVIPKSVKNPVFGTVPNEMQEAPNARSQRLLSSGIEYPELTKHQLAARQAVPKELPMFDGHPEEWPLFISAFENSTRTCGLTDDENLVRLQKCLRGRALDAIRSRLFHPQQVPHIIATLKMLFGKPEMIINSLIYKIRQDPSPKTEKLETIVKYALAVENICATMEMAELNSHLNNPILLQELIEKLPPQIRLNWGIYKQTLTTVNLPSFSSWLFQVGQAATEVTPLSFAVSETKVERKRYDTSYLNAHESSIRTCLICNSNCPSVDKCSVFTNCDLGKKWEMVKQKQLCRTCLRRHKKKCTSSLICGEQGCTFRHHKLLHNVKKHNNVPPLTVVPSSIHHTDGKDNSVLFKVVPVVVYGKNISVQTYAFLDEGSSVTLMEEDLADQLNISGKRSPLHLKWTSNTTRTELNSRNINVEISGLSQRKYTISGVRTVSSLALPAQSIDWDYLSGKYPHLSGLPAQSYANAQPQILIGLRHWKLGLPLKIKEGKRDEPVATKTRLGWVIFGPYNNQRLFESCNLHVCECQREDQLIHETVKQYFAVENIGTKKLRLLTSEEEQAEKILAAKCRKVGDRFEVPLLWKYATVQLPSSKINAERRLLCLERKMEREPNLRKLISELIQHYLEKGYAQRVTENSITNNKVWYLPIFPVFNPNKPNKVRLVWDAASRVNGVSLNTVLLTGPDITSPLLGILFRFRERKVGICADIKEMFHQIQIANDDQDAQRFLWRNMETGQIEVYRLTVMSFGATCSPYCAQYVKNRNARDHLHQYPRAANAIIQSHYVDDYIDSFNSEEEAVSVSKDVILIHSRAGQAQLEHLHNEVTALRTSKVVAHSSPLHKLTPYLDHVGVIRIQGRIDASIEVCFDTKRPVVLPRHHYITFLIVDHYHRKFRHQYNETVVNEVRQRFYIARLRVLMKAVQRRCQYCSNLRAKPHAPLMGELPPARLKAFTRPFSFIGIDFFGPIFVTVGRRREKRWGMLVTCLTIRGIHIEVAHSLSTDSCILALQRFVSRRGMPIHIYSDNGTNFRGASQELCAAVERIDRDKIVESVGEGRLKWTFIPPASPHMGGSWERLIRSVKQTLAVVMPTRNPGDELLITMMTEVENIINTRPLTYVPLTGDEKEALTPNHFILGSSSGIKPLGEFTDDGYVLKRNWLLIEQFGNSFWRRWIKEYLPDLTRRTKWFKTTKSISLDDIVIVIDDNNPRYLWPKGRVIKTTAGTDGIVRSAMVQTAYGVYLRPVSKLAILDVAGSTRCDKPENHTDLSGGTVDEPGSTYTTTSEPPTIQGSQPRRNDSSSTRP